MFLADILLLGKRWPVAEEPGAVREEERLPGGASFGEDRVALRPARVVCRAGAEPAGWNLVRSLDMECGTIGIIACLKFCGTAGYA